MILYIGSRNGPSSVTDFNTPTVPKSERSLSPMPFTLHDLVSDKRLFLGTNNKKKIVELTALLAPRGFELRTPADFPEIYDVDETGETFIENARLKARSQATHRGMWAIGEDSGLCVPALNGAPGVYSARYAGENSNDQANNTLLLERMLDIPNEKRAAYYVSTIALSDPSGEIHLESKGECWGRVLNEPRGAGGFGYDPLFEVIELHATFAELGASVKKAISHRARALRDFMRRFDALTTNT